MNSSQFLIPLLLATHLTANGETIMPAGVTPDGGFYDINKSWIRDENLCWAATASNMIQYFQAKYGVFYQGEAELPNGTINGDWSYSRIFQAFRDSFQDKGSNIAAACNWWFSGEKDPLLPTERASSIQAGFWKAWYADDEKCCTPDELPTNHSDISIINALRHNGPLGLSIYNTDAWISHAVTAWGVETDENGHITAFYLADSDDESSNLEDYDYSRMKLTKYEASLVSNPINGEICYYLNDYLDVGAFIRSYNYLMASESLIALHEEYSASGLYWNGSNSDWTTSHEPGEIPGRDAGWTAYANNRGWDSYYEDGRNVFFTDQTSGKEHRINLVGTLAPSRITIASDQNYYFTGLGSLTGGMYLIKAGEGTLYLLNDNTYTGGTLLQGGTLKIVSNNALGTGAIHAMHGIFDLGGTTLANDISISQGNVQIQNAQNYQGNLRLESGTLKTTGAVKADTLSTTGGKLTISPTVFSSSIFAPTVSISENTRVYFNLSDNNNTSYIEGKESIQFSGDIVLSVDSKMAYSKLNHNRPYKALLISNGYYDYEEDDEKFVLFGKDYATWEGVEISTLLCKYLDKESFHLNVTVPEAYDDYGEIEFTANVNTGAFYADEDINPQLGEMGKKGGAMLDAALHHSDPQTTESDSRLALVMDTIDTAISRGDRVTAAHLEAALAGNTTTCLGTAYADQTTLRLHSLLNMVHMRAATERQATTDSFQPSIWFQGDYSHHELDRNGEQAGYTLNSWGGTLGTDVNIAPHFIAGAAFSASWGDLKSSAADTAQGNLDCMDVTVYMQQEIGSWQHTLLLSGGTADIKLNRNLPVAGETQGSTSGYEWSALYEVAYSFNLTGHTKEEPHLLTPLVQLGWTSVHVDGYRETGAGNAGLAVGKQNHDYGNVQLGLNYTKSIKTGLSTTPCYFEAQAGIVQYLKSRRGTSSVSLQGYGSDIYRINGNKPDNLEAELEARIIIPVAQQTDFIIQATGNLGARSNRYNANIGLRYQF